MKEKVNKITAAMEHGNWNMQWKMERDIEWNMQWNMEIGTCNGK